MFIHAAVHRLCRQGLRPAHAHAVRDRADAHRRPRPRHRRCRRTRCASTAASPSTRTTTASRSTRRKASASPRRWAAPTSPSSATTASVVCGERMAWAYDDLYYLERACMAQVLAQSTGRPLLPVDANRSPRACATRRSASACSRSCSSRRCGARCRRRDAPPDRRARRDAAPSPARARRPARSTRSACCGSGRGPSRRTAVRGGPRTSCRARCATALPALDAELRALAVLRADASRRRRLAPPARRPRRRPAPSRRVLLPRDGVCVSTQVGCAVGCVFCMTGRDGLLAPARQRRDRRAGRARADPARR